MNNYKKFIWVTTSFIGFHRWTDAPEKTKFLRLMHRHIFHIKLQIEVFHNDRELEFFDIKERLESFVNINFSNKEDIGSCEMIGEKIIDYFRKKYGCNRKYKVEVSEDNENGSIIIL